jgi:hypothetical protein
MGVKHMLDMMIIETFLGDKRHPGMDGLEEVGSRRANIINVSNKVYNLCRNGNNPTRDI